eukprot:TRINITY_DN850_c0_g1_i3.p1 TRINITY_DN850_c0_g1~~TRINITY_DN850_c0_g1_i3.p1  ORF type:complete len:379 (-),score=33.21 TRINITY_DN850_c0_g1_i3:51-1187(-)
MPAIVSKLKGVQWIPCACHVLNLVAKNSLKASDGVYKLLQKCSEMVSSVKISNKRKMELREKQLALGDTSPKTLKRFVEARFNTSFMMIESVLNAKAALIALKYPLIPFEYEILEELQMLLRPIRELSVALEGEKYPTMSLVYPMMTLLSEALQSVVLEKPVVREVRRSMVAILRKKWADLYRPLPPEIKLGPLILDPRVRASSMYDKVSESERQLKALVECEDVLRSKLPEPQSESSSLDHAASSPTKLFGINYGSRVSFHREKQDSDLLTRYLLAVESDPPRLGSETSVEWYTRHPKLAPVFALFRELAGCPAAACSVERLWSVAKRLNSDLRDSMGDNTFSQLLYLRQNGPLAKKLGLRCRFIDVDFPIRGLIFR